jgi:hypothetical protein
MSVERKPSAEQPADDDGESILLMRPWVLWGWLVVCVIACVPVVYAYAPVEWGMMRTLFAGVLMGVLSHYLLFINRILVAKW